MIENIFAAIAVSANAEWRAVRTEIPDAVIQPMPYGEYFTQVVAGKPVVFFHGGWGKISAAATAQYAIDHWKPEILMNLGTCGGFAGRIDRGTTILVERTVVYDIIEQMGDAEAAIRFYSVSLDLSWLAEPYPQPVQRGLLVSADRDICPPDIPMLIESYGAVAADWESGAIAWVANQNNTRCLILRGVSDLVGQSGGEAYSGDISVFQNAARQVMRSLLQALPGWLKCC